MGSIIEKDTTVNCWCHILVVAIRVEKSPNPIFDDVWIYG